jgi:hypothetical protein
MGAPRFVHYRAPMKTLIKLAVGAAIAGALVNLLTNRRREALPAPPEKQGDSEPAQQFSLNEVAEENAEWGGGSSGLAS